MEPLVPVFVMLPVVELVTTTRPPFPTLPVPDPSPALVMIDPSVESTITRRPPLPPFVFPLVALLPLARTPPAKPEKVMSCIVVVPYAEPALTEEVAVTA